MGYLWQNTENSHSLANLSNRIWVYVGLDPYCEVSGADSDVGEDASVVECDAVMLGECQPTFRHFKTRGTTRQTTRRHIPEARNPRVRSAN